MKAEYVRFFVPSLFTRASRRQQQGSEGSGFGFRNTIEEYISFGIASRGIGRAHFYQTLVFLDSRRLTLQFNCFNKHSITEK